MATSEILGRGFEKRQVFAKDFGSVVTHPNRITSAVIAAEIVLPFDAGFHGASLHEGQNVQ